MKAKFISQEHQIVVERRKDYAKESFGHLSFLSSVFRMGVTEIKKGVAQLHFLEKGTGLLVDVIPLNPISFVLTILF